MREQLFNNEFKAGQPDDDRFGAYCMDEGLRTTTGGGNFNPRKQCEKAFPDHSKTQCCGQYPNRYVFHQTIPTGHFGPNHG